MESNYHNLRKNESNKLSTDIGVKYFVFCLLVSRKLSLWRHFSVFIFPFFLADNGAILSRRMMQLRSIESPKKCLSIGKRLKAPSGRTAA